MGNSTQLGRYKQLLHYIDENLSQDINIKTIEAACNYSYRNINRIFEAIHKETIGKYIKRLRLEKGAQFLKYSAAGVSEIAYEIGFEDRASFSKAFKAKYGHSPSDFRDKNEQIREQIQTNILMKEGENREKLEFEIEYLPEFSFLFLEYKGSEKNNKAIDNAWNEVIEFSMQNKLFPKEPIFMTEIIDDVEISDEIHTRYNFGHLIEGYPISELKGLFRIKTHKRQKYAKFIVKGSEGTNFDFYHKLYAFWMLDVNLELEDLPSLEFYPNADFTTYKNELITEVYIPVQ